MSEYQYIGFRAVDSPLSGENLAFMKQQSTRARITKWLFENEYHYGDFGGDSLEMLRRGYDIHLHYANFGIRNLYIRLPDGLANPDLVRQYINDESLTFHKDKKGPGGTLAICPYYEPDDLEELWDLEEIIDNLVSLRSEIIAGDPRPLYLAHLAISRYADHDPEETMEAPIPAGLKNLTNAQLALAELYEIDESVLIAAARENDSHAPDTNRDIGTQTGSTNSRRR